MQPRALALPIIMVSAVGSHATPPPGEEPRPDQGTRRDWGGVRRFVREQRVQEQQAVSTAVNDLRAVTCASVDTLRRALTAEQATDGQVRDRTAHLREVVGAAPSRRSSGKCSRPCWPSARSRRCERSGWKSAMQCCPSPPHIGVAANRPFDTAADWGESADRALHAAKQAGRNQVAEG
jgi:hypothetical protein